MLAAGARLAGCLHRGRSGARVSERPWVTSRLPVSRTASVSRYNLEDSTTGRERRKGQALVEAGRRAAGQ